MTIKGEGRRNGRAIFFEVKTVSERWHSMYGGLTRKKPSKGERKEPNFQSSLHV